jgi:ribosomal protein L37AE/L43A
MIPSGATPRDDLRRLSAVEQRKDKPTCESCGSSDLWRIARPAGIIAAIMRYRGRKPFQCRKCGQICYQPGRREKDQTAY